MLLINDICKEQGITQKELAEKIGITPVGLNKAINGNPTKTTLEKVAKALNVKVSDLFAEDEEPKKEKKSTKYDKTHLYQYRETGHFFLSHNQS